MADGFEGPRLSTKGGGKRVTLVQVNDEDNPCGYMLPVRVGGDRQIVAVQAMLDSGAVPYSGASKSLLDRIGGTRIRERLVQSTSGFSVNWLRGIVVYAPTGAYQHMAVVELPGLPWPELILGPDFDYRLGLRSTLRDGYFTVRQRGASGQHLSTRPPDTVKGAVRLAAKLAAHNLKQVGVPGSSVLSAIRSRVCEAMSARDSSVSVQGPARSCLVPCVTQQTKTPLSFGSPNPGAVSF